jgi:hypothetical protein
MPKKKKRPIDMTSEELAKHVFHPKLLKHVKRHVAKLDASNTKKA